MSGFPQHIGLYREDLIYLGAMMILTQVGTAGQGVISLQNRDIEAAVRAATRVYQQTREEWQPPAYLSKD